MTYTVMDKMTFGKYKGRLISEVLKIPGGKGYLRWAVEHVSFFVIDEILRRSIGYSKKLAVDPEPRMPPIVVDEKEVDEIVKYIFS